MSSFSDQTSGFRSETDDNDNDNNATTSDYSEVSQEGHPDATQTGQGPTVDSREAMETATANNSAYIEPEEDEIVATQYEGEPETVEREFAYKAHMDPQRQKDPFGTYGDDVQRRQAEVERARKEGREPDFDNMSPTVGDVVVTKEQAQNVSTAEPVRGVPVQLTADVVVGQPAVTDAEGNPPPEQLDVSDQGHPEGSVAESLALQNEAEKNDGSYVQDNNKDTV